MFRVIDGVDRAAEEEIGCSIESETEAHIVHIEGRAVHRELCEKVLDVAFKGVEISNALLNELSADKSTGIMPELAVGGEDGVTEEVKPSRVEELALTF